MAINPKSLANLRNDGRTPDYDEPKKKRELTVTDTGWNSAKEIIKTAGFSSVSQFLEELGRGNAAIIHRKPSDKMAEETKD